MSWMGFRLIGRGEGERGGQAVKIQAMMRPKDGRLVVCSFSNVAAACIQKITRLGDMQIWDRPPESQREQAHGVSSKSWH